MSKCSFTAVITKSITDECRCHLMVMGTRREVWVDAESQRSRKRTRRAIRQDFGKSVKIHG